MIEAYKYYSNLYIEKWAFPLLCFLFFLIPFGSVAEINWFPALGSKAKLQSVIGSLYIVLGLLSGLFIKGLYKYPFAVLYVGSLLILVIGVLINTGIQKPLNIAKLSIYPIYLIFLFLITSGLNINKKRLIYVLSIFLISAIFVTIISIVDFIGIFKFYFLNKDTSYTSLFGYDFPCMSGFFNSRTSYSFVLSMALAILLFFSQLNINTNVSNYVTKGNLFRIIPFTLKFDTKQINIKNIYYLLGFCLLILLFAAFATHQRAIILTVSLTFLILLIIRFKTNLTLIFFAGLFLFSFAFLLIYFTSDTSQFDINSSTFRIRINAYIFTFATIPGNPLGTGYGLIEDIKYSMINPHNSYLLIILTSGIYGFVLVFLFMFPILKAFFRMERNDTDKFLFLILFCWLFTQFFHNVINSTFGWCFMGILVSYLNGYKFKLKF